MIVAQRDETQRAVLMRFFKTGKGQYGEGDQFLGLKVPTTRAVVKSVYKSVDLQEIPALLHSPWHEVRLCGFLLLVEMMKENLPKRRDSAATLEDKRLRRCEIADLYLANARQANNWDLVDLSCPYILGPYLRQNESGGYDLLLQLAYSENLWEQRIAIVTTLDFIRNGILEPTIRLSERLLSHPHDLIHKATGWALRELGKRDETLLTSFLETHYRQIPRTTLRYAIERLPAPVRQFWLTRK